MALGNEPARPEILTRADLEVGLRVMLPDGQMHGVITAVEDDGFALHFDNTRTPMEYDWGYERNLVRES